MFGYKSKAGKEKWVKLFDELRELGERRIQEMEGDGTRCRFLTVFENGLRK